MKLDLGIRTDNPLYDGVEIQEVGGRATVEATQATIDKIASNATKIADAAPDRSVVTLTGPTPKWIDMKVVLIMRPRFRQVRYNDGRGVELVLSQE